LSSTDTVVLPMLSLISGILVGTQERGAQDQKSEWTRDQGPRGNKSILWQTNSRTVKSRTGQLAKMFDL